MAAVTSLRADRRFIVVLFLLIALTVAARLPLLHQSLWLDEVASARVVTQPTLPKMLAQVRRTESTPPAWYTIAWVTEKVTGSGSGDVATLRWLSILFSAAATALTLIYARRILLLPGAALAGAGVALGPAFVEHGAELRAYALLTLVSIAFAIALERSAATPSRRRLAALAGVVMLGSFTHYFFFFTLLAGLCWVWARRPSASYRWPVTASVCAGLLPFLAWLPSFLHQYGRKLYSRMGPFHPRGVLFVYAHIFGTFSQDTTFNTVGRLAVLLLVLAGAWLLVRRPREISLAPRSDGLLCAELAILPVAAAAVLWAFGEHIFNARNLLGAGPFAAIALAAALSSLPRRYSYVAMVLTAGVLIHALSKVDRVWGRADYQGIANVLVRDGWRSNEDLIYFGPAPHGILTPVGWYLPERVTLSAPRRGALSCPIPTFLISYDHSNGPRWLHRHDSQILIVNKFRAYNHAPLGHPASMPIYVARLRRSPSLSQDAIKHGGRIYAVRVRGSASGCT